MSTQSESALPPERTRRPRIAGIGRVLVVIYAILALGATGRSVVQILHQFNDAPVAYSLSAVSAVVYIVATIALVARGAIWYRVAWVTISFEMLGVLVVGTLSVTQPELFNHASVWSYYGVGYVFVPLVLPVLGMIWLATHKPVALSQLPADETAQSETGATK
ncbi:MULTISPECIES: hypothetical protein [Subtercola]|uniref:DNA uptake lipoprotein n=1 Tax=Subtercola vilae TaxID=2056433 RepID=A0A4T2BP35_9MICO|nr:MULTISPECIES: hypothetical protein [Subtercola]MEA9986727.1 hypothetical protein [Subtercola sp. RTI3]TIH31186.1 hypothetical protein D4765_16675 [Subtercola vilae]